MTATGDPATLKQGRLILPRQRLARTVPMRVIDHDPAVAIRTVGVAARTPGPNRSRDAMNDVTRVLDAIDRGEPRAASELLPLVYDELRKLAAQKLAQEKPGQTLDATALVHEAYLRLVEGGKDGAPRASDPIWANRRHFFAAAAEAMRRILVENARRKGREKHGGGRRREARRSRRPQCQRVSARRPGLARGPGAVRPPRPAQGQARRAALLRRPDPGAGGLLAWTSPSPPPTGHGGMPAPGSTPPWPAPIPRKTPTPPERSGRTESH